MKNETPSSNHHLHIDVNHSDLCKHSTAKIVVPFHILHITSTIIDCLLFKVFCMALNYIIVYIHTSYNFAVTIILFIYAACIHTTD